MSSHSTLEEGDDTSAHQVGFGLAPSKLTLPAADFELPAGGWSNRVDPAAEGLVEVDAVPMVINGHAVLSEMSRHTPVDQVATTC